MTFCKAIASLLLLFLLLSTNVMQGQGHNSAVRPEFDRMSNLKRSQDILFTLQSATRAVVSAIGGGAQLGQMDTTHRSRPFDSR